MADPFKAFILPRGVHKGGGADPPVFGAGDVTGASYTEYRILTLGNWAFHSLERFAR